MKRARRGAVKTTAARSWWLLHVTAPGGYLVAVPLCPRRWWILGLEVAAPSRGRGIASALLERLTAEVGPRAEIRLFVEEGNDAAHRLFARRGFRLLAGADAPPGHLAMVRGPAALVRSA